jgi:hypothetical protein
MKAGIYAMISKKIASAPQDGSGVVITEDDVEDLKVGFFFMGWCQFLKDRLLSKACVHVSCLFRMVCLSGRTSEEDLNIGLWSCCSAVNICIQ